jgi:hypothetical protein
VNHKEQAGFVTFAQNTDQVDYLELAAVQAQNIKLTQKLNRTAVIVDSATKEKVNDDHRGVFDYIIDLPHDYNDPTNARKFANEWQVFWLTPFKETVKLESDLLFTRSIDHWWTAFRLRNVCLSVGARDYRGNRNYKNLYRREFPENELPDVYNGLMYFRYSQEAVQFFNVARAVFNNWAHIRDNLLINCRDETPSTDVLYAVTALIVGPENCTAHSLDFINFTHMKSAFNGWSDNRMWTDTVVGETDGNMIRINNLNQYHPVHYYDKDYVKR